MRSDSSKPLSYRVLRFLTSRQFLILSFALIALAIGLRFYGNLRSETIVVNPKDKTTPQFAYRKDELALLQIALDKLIQAESEKRYSQIYTQMASRRFQHNVPQRVFLKMSNCVEKYLGDVVSYDRDNNGFIRKTTKGRLVDSLQLHVERSETPLEEQYVFEWDGVDVRVGGIYWMTDKPFFHQCMAEIRAEQRHLNLNNAGALQGVKDSTEEKSTEIEAKPADEDASGDQPLEQIDQNQSADQAETPDETSGQNHQAKQSATGENAPAVSRQEAASERPKNTASPASNPEKLPEKPEDAPTGTMTLQDEAKKQKSITDFGPPVVEGSQSGESSRPPE
ncbi:MAG: hypothetical protein VKJ04_07680 [Vampirovibrionales bacterium]|nr:hypothetical protein [Vampirovibrionales bacterium]